MSDPTTTFADELTRHVKASRKVIRHWEKHGIPGAGGDEGMRKASEEIALLESFAAAHPRKATQLLELADRYRALRNAMATDEAA